MVTQHCKSFAEGYCFSNVIIHVAVIQSTMELCSFKGE